MNSYDREAATCSCPIPGCKGRRQNHQLLCPDHWFKVPAELRRRIWASFHSGLFGTEEHRALCLEAIRLVNEGGR